MRKGFKNIYNIKPSAQVVKSPRILPETLSITKCRQVVLVRVEAMSSKEKQWVKTRIWNPEKWQYEDQYVPSMEVQKDEAEDHSWKTPKERVTCKYYILGRCQRGSYCEWYHPPEEQMWKYRSQTGSSKEWYQESRDTTHEGSGTRDVNETMFEMLATSRESYANIVEDFIRLHGLDKGVKWDLDASIS